MVVYHNTKATIIKVVAVVVTAIVVTVAICGRFESPDPIVVQQSVVPRVVDSSRTATSVLADGLLRELPAGPCAREPNRTEGVEGRQVASQVAPAGLAQKEGKRESSMVRGMDLVEAGLTAQEAEYLDAVIENICGRQFFASPEDDILVSIRPNLAKYLKDQSVTFRRVGNPRFAGLGGYMLGTTDLSHITGVREFAAKIEDKFGSLTLRVKDTVGAKELWDRFAQGRH